MTAAEDLGRYLPDEEATLAFGERLGANAVRQQKPLVIYLTGSLGAGKTTFSRGFLRGMGHKGRVRSPTYTLLEPYQTDSLPVAHLDLYRLGDPEELEFLGIRELVDGGHILLVEWPERGFGHLPVADLMLVLQTDGEGRRLVIEPGTPLAREWLAEISPI